VEEWNWCGFGGVCESYGLFWGIGRKNYMRDETCIFNEVVVLNFSSL